MNAVHCWWEGLPNERFWLVVSRFENGKDVLEVPDEDRNDVASWVSDLVAYVPPRDVIFHYHPTSQAIVSWAKPRGRAERREPGWSLTGMHDRSAARPRWVLKVKDRRPLAPAVTAAEIASIQWELFPALRALEDKVGDPLYYPFAMGSPDETHTLPGRVFKLPALFVERFPVLAAVASETRAPKAARAARHRASSWWTALDDLLEPRTKAARRAG